MTRRFDFSNPILRAVIIAVGLIALTAAMSYTLPPAIDWHNTFRPAAREVLAGRSPFNIDGFLNAPWAILPLLPLALLPENVGRALLLIMSLLALAYTAHRLKAQPLALGVFLVSPPVLHGLLNGNIDWLAAFGFILPPQIGLFFIVIKPQVGAAVGLFWLVEAWRKGKFWEIVRVFGPATLALLLSLVIFGLWPLRYPRQLGEWWNASLWPMSIPVGLALLIASIRKCKIEYAMGASPCLSPYVLFHSWVGALLAIVSSLPETLAAVAGLWLLVFIRFLQG